MYKAATLVISVFILNCAELSAQVLTVNELVMLSNNITTLYESNKNEINGIIDNYISKGFVVDEYKQFKTTATGTSSTFFSLVNIDKTNNEQLTIQTDNIPLQGSYPQRKICSIEFFTSDFTTFKKWFTDLSTNSAYSRTLHGIAFYKYSYGFRSIQVGEIATLIPPASPGQTISAYIKKDTSGKNSYYIFIQYPFA